MGVYFDELCRAMEALAAMPHTVFLGQSVGCPGTGMSASFANVPREQLIELPVIEDAQLGMSLGMSLAGMLPVSVFPRWNFLILAANQLVNHLDKMPLYSTWKPKVLIRVAAVTAPEMDPGPQHLGDFSDAFRLMLKTVKIVQLTTSRQIGPAYRKAAMREGSTILVEYPELY